MLKLVAESVLKGINILKIIDEVPNKIQFVNIADKLKNKQIYANVSEGCVEKVILDVKTGWNPAFYMLGGFV